jgi:hypothetical protein
LIYSKHTFSRPSGDLCSFCGNQMSHAQGGTWCGHECMLFCCTRCARDVLPIFLANSMLAKDLNEAEKEVYGGVMVTLQRALAGRAERQQWNGPDLNRCMEEDHEKNERYVAECLTSGKWSAGAQARRGGMNVHDIADDYLRRGWATVLIPPARSR